MSRLFENGMKVLWLALIVPVAAAIVLAGALLLTTEPTPTPAPTPTPFEPLEVKGPLPITVLNRLDGYAGPALHAGEPVRIKNNTAIDICNNDGKLHVTLDFKLLTSTELPGFNAGVSILPSPLSGDLDPGCVSQRIGTPTATPRPETLVPLPASVKSGNWRLSFEFLATNIEGKQQRLSLESELFTVVP